jgi:predicted secreted Zn-dependent protease
MVRARASLGWILILAACSGPARAIAPSPTNTATPPPTVSVSVSHDDYAIDGSTEEELRAEMDRLGPSGFDAYTEWHVLWSYSYSETEDSCSALTVTVVVAIIFKLPRWDAPARAPPDLVDKWHAYVAALQAHEDGHKDIAIEAATQVRRVLQALPVYPTCDELDRAANAAGERVLDQHRQREQAYDRTTQHGATQGARFP